MTRPMPSPTPSPDSTPGKRVPTCPEWAVRNLVAHVGLIHRRATLIVQTGEAVPFSNEGDVPADWGTWLREGAEGLARAVAQAGDKEVWSFLGGTQPASFWLRRMLHDTTIHAVDAALTAETSYDIPAGLAADGIDEVLSLLELMEGINPRVRGASRRRRDAAIVLDAG
ncbi:maleylpyruvate isomerase family mycothiol-dependent enzyme [Kibdelosporangium aridum]|uniref:maleylpyruvate isomerase family mycothiol-dependent enzyme n=1 Tax=Kibdelosporangium aridum TaxID=2030 RepID=UPI0035E6CC70